MNQRLRALCDLSMGSVREYVGRHEYDGRVEDLSPEGVRRPGPGRRPVPARAGPARRGAAGRLRAAGAAGAGRAGAVPLQPAVPHRRPRPGLLRPGVRPRGRAGRGPPPPPGRLARRGRRRRDRAGPGGRPGRRGAAGAIRGLAAGLADSGATGGRARPSRPTTARRPSRAAADAATATPPSAAGRWSGCWGRRGPGGRPRTAGGRADAERDRLQAAGRRPAGGWRRAGPPPRWCPGCWDHPDADGVLRGRGNDRTSRSRSPSSATSCPGSTASAWSGRRRSRAGGRMAMMSWAAPGEPDAPSWYHITPPDPAWPERGAARTGCRCSADHAARDHRARGRSRPLLPRRCAAAGGTEVRRTLSPGVRGGLGALRRGALRRGGLPGRRPAVRRRRGAGGAVARHPARLRDRRARGDMTVEDGTAGSRPTPSSRAPPPAPRPPGPRSTRPTGGTRGASWRSCACATGPAPWGAGFSLQRFHDRMLASAPRPSACWGPRWRRQRKAARVVRSVLEPFAAGCCTDSGPAGSCFTRERPRSADLAGLLLVTAGSRAAGTTPRCCGSPVPPIRARSWCGGGNWTGRAGCASARARSSPPSCCFPPVGPAHSQDSDWFNWPSYSRLRGGGCLRLPGRQREPPPRSSSSGHDAASTPVAVHERRPGSPLSRGTHIVSSTTIVRSR